MSTPTCIPLKFSHGLGDCANFARMLQMYERRGYTVSVLADSRKQWLFNNFVEDPKECLIHSWPYVGPSTELRYGKGWTGNKGGRLISKSPLPDIGSADSLWDEYCSQKFNRKRISKEVKAEVEDALKDLSRPLVFFHPEGMTNNFRKQVPPVRQREFYDEFLKQCEGTLIIMDWDNKIPYVEHFRIRHLDHILRKANIEQFTEMLYHGILVGVDSGPLHMAQWCGTPAVGLWLTSHCSSYVVPQKPNLTSLQIQFGEDKYKINPWKRIEFGIVQQLTFDAKEVVRKCLSLLEKNKYVTNHYMNVNQKYRAILDIQLEQWINEFCASPLEVDRYRSFDMALRELSARITSPHIVETGCIRQAEDWPGAGFSTYLFGAYCYGTGGKLDSIDTNKTNCTFAKDYCSCFGDTVRTHVSKGVDWIKKSERSIDLLYLDSLDAYLPGHAENCLEEAKAAQKLLRSKHSMILIDDTPYDGKGKLRGKGTQALPYLLDNGWEIKYQGWQLLLGKKGVYTHVI